MVLFNFPVFNWRSLYGRLLTFSVILIAPVVDPPLSVYDLYLPSAARRCYWCVIYAQARVVTTPLDVETLASTFHICRWYHHLECQAEATSRAKRARASVMVNAVRWHGGRRQGDAAAVVAVTSTKNTPAFRTQLWCNATYDTSSFSEDVFCAVMQLL